MQVIVLGMHRSGTSMLARLLNMMGLYFAPEGLSNGVNEENPTGFWERKDVRYINDRILHAQHCDWDLLADFDPDTFFDQCSEEHRREIQRIVFEMDAHRPWFIKEPRLCLLLPLWRQALAMPVSVFVYRDPLEVAHSLQTRSGMPLEAGRALWERYNLCALQASAGLRTLFIAHQDLMADPVATSGRVYEFLLDSGLRNLSAPSEQELLSYIQPSLYRQRQSKSAEHTETERAILECLRNGQPGQSIPAFPAHSQQMLNNYQQAQLQHREINADIPFETELERNLGAIKRNLERVRERITENNRNTGERFVQNNKQHSQRFKAVDERMVQLTAQLRKAEQRATQLEVEADQQRQQLANRLDTLQDAILLAKPSLGRRILGRIKLALQLALLPLRKRPRQGLRYQRDYVQLRRSGQFDYSFYLRENPDVALSGINPLLHFVIHGNAAKRKPRANFSVAAYARDHALDLNLNNAFVHYLRYAVPRSKLRHGQGQLEKSRRLKITVLCWDMGHNPLGRAYLIADMLSREHDVELWGAHFPRFGTDLWEPLRELSTIPVRTWPGADLPDYYDTLADQLAELDCDVLYVCKPRYPSIAFGLMAKTQLGIPVVLDVDDHELSFFSKAEAMEFEQALQQTQAEDFSCSHDALWTQVSESLVDFADAKTVSNTALQARYGGEVLAHVRDETVFCPDADVRRALRSELGVAEQDKVILFIGTPRLHKGVAAVHQVLQQLNRPDYKLLVIGTPADPAARAFFEENSSDSLLQLDNISFSRLSDYLNVGDLICLLQDREHPVSQYQLPAKLIDAIAMAVPVLVSNVPPVQEYIERGLAIAVSEDKLGSVITEIFDNHAAYKAQAVSNRRQFVGTLSYAAALPRISALLQQAVDQACPVDAEHQRVSDHIASYFSQAQSQRLLQAARAHQQRNKPLYNIVYFWKQNDSGIYGRRQDMLVKYLLAHDQVNKLVHIDAPVSRRWLYEEFRKSRQHRNSQHKYVFRNTLARMRSQTDGKLTELVYVHKRSSHGVGQYIQGYLRFLEERFEQLSVFEAGVQTVFVVCPKSFEFPFIRRRFQPDRVVADVIDNHLKWPVNSVMAERLDKNYREILQHADLVVSNNETNQQDMHSYCDTVHLLPNAGELFSDEQLQVMERPPELQGIQGPIVGYVGNLDILRLDLPLLQRLITERPAVQYVFIGSMHQNKDISKLADYANVHFLGTRKYQESLAFIRYFDAAIIPHLHNELTSVMDPLKLYVYLSVGVPVISTPVELNRELRDSVHIAHNADEFLLELDRLCATGEPIQQRSSYLCYQNSWQQRVAWLLDRLDQLDNSAS